jgi:hypothetical protein
LFYIVTQVRRFWVGASTVCFVGALLVASLWLHEQVIVEQEIGEEQSGLEGDKCLYE